MDILLVLCAIWLTPPLIYLAGVLVLDIPQRPSVRRIILLIAPALGWLVAWPLLAFILLYPSL